MKYKVGSNIESVLEMSASRNNTPGEFETPVLVVIKPIHIHEITFSSLRWQ